MAKLSWAASVKQATRRVTIIYAEIFSIIELSLLKIIKIKKFLIEEYENFCRQSGIIILIIMGYKQNF